MILFECGVKHMIIPKAAYEILKDHPEGLSAKEITEEIIARNLHPLSAKDPVAIITRAIMRHCIGIDRSYSCQDRYFSRSTNNKNETIYKIAANYDTTATSFTDNFVFPQQQIIAINNSSRSSGYKSRIMDAENQTIRNLLDKYCFYVPDYQRSYSWKSSHIDEFLDDIFNIIHSSNVDARHFLGAITMAKAKRDSHQDSIDLIDGQQRMTTIFIFLYVILGLFKSPRFADKAKGRPDQLLRKLVYKNDDGEITRSRLNLGEFNRKFFKEFCIDAHDASIEEQENIKKKYIENSEFNQNQSIFDAYNKIKLAIEERLDCCKSEDESCEYLKALHTCVLDRVELVTMTVEEEADAFLIFETLNDRGLVLSSIDLIKNKFFQTFATRSKDEFDMLKKEWEEMCDNIENKDDIKKYLLHYWRAFKGYTTDQTLYITCRDHITTNGFAEAKKILLDLKEYSIYYNGLCNPGGSYPWKDQGIKDILSDMKKLHYDLTHPILLAALKKYPHDEDSFKTVARLCLNFMIRYISVLKEKPTSIVKDICSWACDANFSIEMLRKNFSKKASDASFKEALLTLTLSYQSPLAHYLLCVYEAEGFNRKEVWTSPGRYNNTIEHILPPTIKPTDSHGKYWLKQIGSMENCTLFKERLGNYAFLTKSAQSKAKNKDFLSKKDVYANDTDMHLTQELTTFNQWSKATIKQRQEKMTDIWVKSISF